MKKRALWIVILSALLCLSILFSACSPTESESIPEDSEMTDAPKLDYDDVILPDGDVDYDALLGEWGKYLKSVGYKEKAAFNTAESLFESEIDGDTKVTVTNYGKIAEVVKTKAEKRDPMTGELISPRQQSTTFYNLETGSKISTTEKTSLNIWDDEIKLFERQYSTRVYFNTIIEVKSSNLVRTDEDGNPLMVYENSYSYYLADGSVICRGLDTSAKEIITSGVNALEIKDTIYHCRDGEIILTTEKGNPHAIPNFTMEYADHKYSIENGKLQVIDNEYKLVVDYQIPGYIKDSSTFRYYVLSNGSVYFYATERCYDNEGKYDYEATNGDKYRVWHVIVDLKGNETVVAAPFILSQNSEIGGLISNFDTENTGIELCGDYQYAEIVRIENGFLATDVDFVILDNTLSEVAKLPKILKNQTTIAEGFGNDKLLFYVDNVNRTEAGYIADMSDGTIARFFNTDTRYYKINGGVALSNGKIYNNMLKEVNEIVIPDGETIKVNGGAIFYNEYTVEEVIVDEPQTGEYDTDEYDTFYDTYYEDMEYDTNEYGQKVEYVSYDKYYVCYVDRYGYCVENSLGSNVTVRYTSGIYFVHTADGSIQLYNSLGERIYLNNEYSISNISIQVVCDDCVVVRATHSYEDINGVEQIMKYEYYTIR